MQDRMHEIVLGDRSLLLKLLAQLLRVHTEDLAICRERSRESAGLQFKSPDRGGKEVVVGQGGRFCKVYDFAGNGVNVLCHGHLP